MVNNNTMNGKETRFVIKRSGEQVLFEAEKIKYAVLKAMKSIGEVDDEMAEKIARITRKGIFRDEKDKVPHVDEIHDMVENKLMDNGLNDVAKEYIIYRKNHGPNIFTKRKNLKPYEYPNLNEYVDAIRHSYWVHTEFNFTSDIQDFDATNALVSSPLFCPQRTAAAFSEVFQNMTWTSIPTFLVCFEL